MPKPIDSRYLVYLARQKSKDLRQYFDPYEEVKDKSPEAITMFFAFLFIEGLYQERKINKQTKDDFEKRIENELQALALKNRNISDIFNSNLSKMQKAMQKGQWSEALPYAMQCLACSTTPSTIDFTGFYEHCRNKNNPVPED